MLCLRLLDEKLRGYRNAFRNISIESDRLSVIARVHIYHNQQLKFCPMSL